MLRLPKLLAGPIIRRVEPTQAYFWMAMSAPYHINGKLMEVVSQDTYQPISVKTSTTMIRLGEQLYIYLVKMKPEKEKLPFDTLLAYNFTFTGKNEKLDFGSLGLLSENNPQNIVYGKLKYPTFFISSGNDKTLFGSCRKLHGKGEDALAAGDEKLKKTHLQLEARPSSLFMLGDQIYADDVADPIFPFILRLAKALIGETEKLEVIEPRLKETYFQTSLEQVHGRQFMMEKLCRFTSTHAENHLITYGEFAAMYLLSLSPEIWQLANEQRLIPTFEELTRQEDYYFIYPKEEGYEEAYAREYQEKQTAYLEQLENLEQFQQTLPQVRRLLANIPTYMIFDDHDITDDWNISLEWTENVYHSPLGKHVIANGLGAYWAFQGWGNDPQQFNQEFIAKMQKYVTHYHVQTDDYYNWKETLLSFDKWSFVAPTKPKAIFFDTRTKRNYDILPKPFKKGKIFKEITAGPQLLNEKSWRTVTNQLKASGWVKKEPLIIVSSAPFYGIRLFESFFTNYILPLKIFRLPVQTTFDLEDWRYNGRGVTRFYEALLNWAPSTSIILSGDSHMASMVKAKVSIKGNPSNELYQFTSSPMKNDSFSPLSELFLKGLLRLYTLGNGKNELHRSCDNSFHIHFAKEEENPSACLWKEHIQYQTLKNGNIIETNNNLGFLTVNKDIQVEFLQLEKKE